MRVLPFLLLLIVSKRSAAQDVLVQDAWRILQSEIGVAQVIGLGESGHGFETYNQAKAKVFSFLYHELGYRRLVFESSFTLSVMSYLKGGTLEERLQGFLYPFWNTISVRNGLHPLYLEEQKSSEPRILGCDIQEDCRYVAFSDYLLQNGWVREKKDRLLAGDSLLTRCIGKEAIQNNLSEMEHRFLLACYDEVTTEVERRQPVDLKQKLLLRCLENRKWLCHYLTLKSTTERMHYRDSLMAENVKWVCQQIPGSGKLVLWTTNLHSAPLSSTSHHPQWMGERLSRSLAANYYALSFDKKSRASNRHRLEENIYLTFPDNGSSFPAIVQCDAIVKIKKEEWITPCE